MPKYRIANSGFVYWHTLFSVFRPLVCNWCHKAFEVVKISNKTIEKYCMLKIIMYFCSRMHNMQAH